MGQNRSSIAANAPARGGGSAALISRPLRQRGRNRDLDDLAGGIAAATVEQHQRPVIVGHRAQHPQKHRAEPQPSARAVPHLHAEKPRAMRMQADRGQVEIGHGKPCPVRQILERFEELGEIHPAKAQKPPDRLGPGLGDEIGAEILQKIIRLAREPRRERRDKACRHLGVAGHQRLEGGVVDIEVPRHLLPDRITIAVPDETLDRMIDQPVHGALHPDAHSLATKV
jgi:hypothetical protein